MKISNRNLRRLYKMVPGFLFPLKPVILKKLLKKYGKDLRIGGNVNLINDNITIGDNVFIGDRTTIAGIVPVTIGDNVMFGPEVMIRGGDHNFSVVGKPMAEVKTGGINLPIIIEDDVWIGTRVIILKGVKICEGAIVGAGSLVTREVPPYSINVGSPSRPIRCRFSKENLKIHLQKVNSPYSFENIVNIYSKRGIPFSNE